MKKTVFILAGVLAVGGVAYLYFTNKKKQTALLSGGTSGAGSTSATPTTTTSSAGVGSSAINTEIAPLPTSTIITSTTKAPTIEEQIKLDKANDIAETIKKYYGLSANAERLRMFKPPTFNQIWSKPSNPYPAMISKLKDDLLKLGYEYKGEKDGVLVKL
jgi:hypothetical protein